MSHTVERYVKYTNSLTIVRNFGLVEKSLWFKSCCGVGFTRDHNKA